MTIPHISPRDTASPHDEYGVNFWPSQASALHLASDGERRERHVLLTKPWCYRSQNCAYGADLHLWLKLAPLLTFVYAFTRGPTGLIAVRDAGRLRTGVDTDTRSLLSLHANNYPPMGLSDRIPQTKRGLRFVACTVT